MTDRTGAGVRSSRREKGYRRQKMLSSVKKGKSLSSYIEEGRYLLRVKFLSVSSGKAKNVHHSQLPW